MSILLRRSTSFVVKNLFQKVSLFVSLFSILTSCNLEQQQAPGAKEAIESVKSRQIKRVTNTQLTVIVDDWGRRIVQQIQAQAEQQLASANADKEAVCNLEGLPKVAELSKLYAVEITLLGKKDLQNPVLSPKEKEVLDAYLYNAENGLSQITNIQKIGDSLLIYSAPIDTKNIVCQKCFGEGKTPLAVWQVKFQKDEVIKKVNPKSLEKLKKKQD
ncbi:MAG: hypothetical protein ACK4GN_13015 [Runella sp.]